MTFPLSILWRQKANTILTTQNNTWAKKYIVTATFYRGSTQIQPFFRPHGPCSVPATALRGARRPRRAGQQSAECEPP